MDTVEIGGKKKRTAFFFILVYLFDDSMATVHVSALLFPIRVVFHFFLTANDVMRADWSVIVKYLIFFCC